MTIELSIYGKLKEILLNFLKIAYAYNQECAKVIRGNPTAWQAMTTQQIYMEGVRIMNMFHPAGMNPNICLPIRFKGL